VPLILLPL